MNENLFIYTLIYCLSIGIAATGLWLQRQWSCYWIVFIFIGLDMHILEKYVFDTLNNQALIEGIGIVLSTTLFSIGFLLLLFHPITQHDFTLDEDYPNILDV